MIDGKTLWLALPVPSLILDGQGRISAVSPAAEGVLNLSRKAVLGALFEQVLPSDHSISHALRRALGNRSELRVSDLAITRPGLGPVTCTLLAAPLPGAEGLLVTLTPHKGIGQTGESDAPHRAARSAIGMAEMLAHEIKNPLAGISGSAQLLSMSLSDEDRTLTDLIVAECQRVVGLLDQVEAFGNLLPPRTRAVNLHDTLTRARQSAEVGFAAHMTVKEIYDPSLPEALVDPDQLLQVLLNLLKNASQASPEGGTIRMRSYYDGSLRHGLPDGSEQNVPLQIEISDDGPGLPEDLAAHIFDPFVSGRENGTGLGLALVSKLMSDNGGLVRVIPQAKGACFCLSLPRAPQNRS